MKRKKQIFVTLAVLAGILFCGFTSEDCRVYDEAALFDVDQIAELEEQIDQASQETGWDIVVATTEDASGMETWEYAEWFYYDAGYGFGGEESDAGLLYLIDLDNGELYFYYSEDAEESFPLGNVDPILDDAYEWAADGAYFESAKTFVSGV